MSLSGRMVKPYADLWLTQWEHLSKHDGPNVFRFCVMIFVTVGAQMPFERLIRAIDTWVKTKNNIEIFAQIGNSSYKPENIEWVNHLEPNEYREYIKKSELVVAHAGMGTILSVLELGKPLMIMPRRGNLSETRNDHQLATAKSFSES